MFSVVYLTIICPFSSQRDWPRQSAVNSCSVIDYDNLQLHENFRPEGVIFYILRLETNVSVRSLTKRLKKQKTEISILEK